jgi:xylulokinase
VAGIALSSQWAGTVACDAQGRPLRPALIWLDSRGADEVRRRVGGFPTIDGYGVFKVLRWIRKTGGAPSLSGKDPVGHIAWLQRHEPETYAKAAVFLEPKDWVNARLTGRVAASFDSIAVHWVTDNRDVSRIAYDDGLLALAGLDRSKLPELVPAGALLGTLTAAAAEELGLPPSVKVFAGAADTHMAAIGAGTTADFDAHLCLGTSSWLLAHVPFKKTDIDHNMASLPAAIPGRYLFVNEQETAAAGLKLLVEKWLAPAGSDPFAAALVKAGQTPPGAAGLMWLPWLHGERSPVDDRSVRGGFVGLSLAHEPGHLVRAVLEGVALNARWLMRHLEQNLGRPLQRVTVVGGGARSDLWCQVLADVFQREVRQVEGPQLANSRGAAMQALVGLGLLDWAAVPSRVRIARTFTPNAQHRALYDDRFEQFLLEVRHRRAMARRFASSSEVT